MTRNRVLARFSRGLAPLLLLLSSVSVVAQQDSSGRLKGQVRQTDGNDLPAVSVRAIHNAKGIERETTTNGRGTYVFKALPIGAYTITFSRDGFETIIEENVNISLGGAAVLDATLAPDGVAIDEQMVVRAGTIKKFDVAETTSGLIISTEETEALPVRRSLDSVAMLAPGTALGDSDFGNGNLVSFGGSSVAENGYYLNGLNITDTRKGIGYVPFPWEAVEQVQVKTGGVPAEFGRHIGGVVNLVTRSGTNDFKFGVTPVWDPEGLQERNPTVFWPDDNGEEQLIINNSEDDYHNREINLYASGPIVKEKAFFYMVYNPRRYDGVSASTSSFYETRTESDFWLGRLDWFISPSHSVELLAFNNEQETVTRQYDYTYEGGADTFRGNTFYNNGGNVWSLKYNGTLTDTFSISAMYGITEYSNNSNADNPELSAIWDSRSGTWVRLGEWVAASINSKLDERTNWRVDGDWLVGDHSIRFGVDREELDVQDLTVPTGDGFYEYYRADADNAYGLPAGTDYVDQRVYTRGGNSGNISESWYIQDSWSVSDSVTLNLGLRNTTFQNTTSDGRTYVDISDQYAPRLGISWDIKGDGASKLYAHYGRFFMPVSPNTNVRMASGELDEHFIYELDGVNPDGTPILGQQIAHEVVSDGVVPDADRLFNQEAGPMYSDEYVVGYERQNSSGWRYGVRGTWRDLIQSIEDVSFNYGLNEWIDQNFPDADHVGGWFAVLTNPGRAITIPYDVDGDGTKELVTVSPEQLGFPASERKYGALEFSLAGKIGDRLDFSSSYTWSHNYGNTEGLLRSDNDQTDPGWTTSFDYPELMEHGYGDLPNDHRHQLKFYGLVNLPANFTTAFNGNVVSGRPLNSFGVHPGTDCRGECYGRIWYGASSFYTDGEPTPRGSAGRTPWVYNLDWNMAWRGEFSAGNLLVKLDVFNVFDMQRATQLEEYAEFSSGANRSYFGQPNSWQSPRSLRLSMRFDF